MKPFLIFVAVAATSYAGYRYWIEHQPPPVVVMVPTPAPTPAGPRLSPEGTYFLLDYYGVHTDHGVTGWTPGQQVRAVSGKEADPDKRWVTDGQLQAEVDQSLLTREIDLAARLTSTDSVAQAAAAREALAAEDQQKAAEKREQADIAKAKARAGQQQTRTVYMKAPTPANPLDRDATPTNGGHQVSRAPKLPYR